MNNNYQRSYADEDKLDRAMSVAVAAGLDWHVEIDKGEVCVTDGARFKKIPPAPKVKAGPGRRRRPTSLHTRLENQKGFPWIYFLRCLGYVKIGMTTNWQARFSSFKGGNPFEIKLVHAIRGDWNVEQDFHERFAKYNHHLEWFNYTGELAEWLEAQPAPSFGRAKRVD